MKNKRMVLNNKGMIALILITTISMLLIMLECDNILLYVTTKIIAIPFMIITLKLSNYLPKKYQ